MKLFALANSCSLVKSILLTINNNGEKETSYIARYILRRAKRI